MCAGRARLTERGFESVMIGKGDAVGDGVADVSMDADGMLDGARQLADDECVGGGAAVRCGRDWLGGVGARAAQYAVSVMIGSDACSSAMKASQSGAFG